MSQPITGHAVITGARFVAARGDALPRALAMTRGKCLAACAAAILAGCSSAAGSSVHGSGGDGGDGSSRAQAACSRDGSDSIAWGTYRGGSPSNPNQVLILLPGPGCGFCWDLNNQDAQAISQGATWSSAWAADHMSIVISIKPDLSSTTSISVSPNGAMLSLTDTITGTPSGFRGDTMPIATCDGMSAANKSGGPGAGSSSGSGSGSSSGSGAQDCPPCWSGWACQDNSQVINYFAGTHNADGSCSLKAQSPNDGTTDITLDCGGMDSQMGTWSNDTDPNGAPAIDFVEGALVLHCDQT